MNSLDQNAELLFGPAPAGPAQAMQFRQGTVIAFNPVTLANTVRVGGADMENLAILGLGDAIALSPGDVVGVLVIGRTMAILGQMLVPGSAGAASATGLLSASTYTASVDATETTTTATWHDLPSLGPVVADVPIGPSGRAMVFLTADCALLVGSGSAEMGYEVSGATSVAAGTKPQWLIHTGAATTVQLATCMVLHEDLNAGLHTFTAKYQAPGLGAGASARFRYRNVTVVAL